MIANILLVIISMLIYAWIVIRVYKRHLAAQKEDVETFGEGNDEQNH